MKILLLGATGRTGKLVLQHALLDGHRVTCLARNIGRIEPHNNLRVLEGSPTDELHLADALMGCDAVISVLNIVRTSDFP